MRVNFPHSGNILSPAGKSPPIRLLIFVTFRLKTPIRLLGFATFRLKPISECSDFISQRYFATSDCSDASLFTKNTHPTARISIFNDILSRPTARISIFNSIMSRPNRQILFILAGKHYPTYKLYIIHTISLNMYYICNILIT